MIGKLSTMETRNRAILVQEWGRAVRIVIHESETNHTVISERQGNLHRLELEGEQNQFSFISPSASPHFYLLIPENSPFISSKHGD